MMSISMRRRQREGTRFGRSGGEGEGRNQGVDGKTEGGGEEQEKMGKKGKALLDSMELTVRMKNRCDQFSMHVVAKIGFVFMNDA